MLNIWLGEVGDARERVGFLEEKKRIIEILIKPSKTVIQCATEEKSNRDWNKSQAAHRWIENSFI